MPDDLGFLVGVLIAVVLVGVLAHFVYNLAKPTVTRRARVIGKRKRSGVSTAECTFEFEDGTRQYYNVSLDAYASLSEGDVGYLSTRGLVFWGFRREGEGIQAPPGAPRGASISEESMAQIKEALFQGRKTEAIRVYRECTGTGLGEAKPAVERLEAELRAAEPDKFAGPSGG